MLSFLYLFFLVFPFCNICYKQLLNKSCFLLILLYLQLTSFFIIKARLHKYRFDYRGDMTVDLCAELLSRNLYYRRFFPYYTESILSGIDENGSCSITVLKISQFFIFFRIIASIKTHIRFVLFFFWDFMFQFFVLIYQRSATFQVKELFSVTILQECCLLLLMLLRDQENR